MYESEINVDRLIKYLDVFSSYLLQDVNDELIKSRKKINSVLINEFLNYLKSLSSEQSISIPLLLMNELVNINKAYTTGSRTYNFYGALRNIENILYPYLIENYSNHLSDNFWFYDEVYKLYKSTEKTKNQATNELEQIEIIKSKINDKLTEFNNLYTEHALKGFKALYADESDEQKKLSEKWLNRSIICAISLLVSIIFCFIINSGILNWINFQDNTNYLFIFANEISFNLVLLAVSLWCVRMYSINRALEINYRHKSVSSDALLSFVEAIKNDEKTKNTVLLEASRMIFAPPETGLTSKNNKMDEKLLETIRDISPINNINSK